MLGLPVLGPAQPGCALLALAGWQRPLPRPQPARQPAAHRTAGRPRRGQTGALARLQPQVLRRLRQRHGRALLLATTCVFCTAAYAGQHALALNCLAIGVHEYPSRCAVLLTSYCTTSRNASHAFNRPELSHTCSNRQRHVSRLQQQLIDASNGHAIARRCERGLRRAASTRRAAQHQLQQLLSLCCCCS